MNAIIANSMLKSFERSLFIFRHEPFLVLLGIAARRVSVFGPFSAYLNLKK